MNPFFSTADTNAVCILKLQSMNTCQLFNNYWMTIIYRILAAIDCLLYMYM